MERKNKTINGRSNIKTFGGLKWAMMNQVMVRERVKEIN